MNFLVLIAAIIACLTQSVASSILGIYSRPVEAGAGVGAGLGGESIYNTRDAGIGAGIGGNVLGISGAGGNGRLLAGTGANERIGPEIRGNPGASATAGAGIRFGLHGGVIGNAGGVGLGAGIRGNVLGASKAGNNEGVIEGAGANGRLRDRIGSNVGASAKAAVGVGNRVGVGARHNVRGGDLETGIGDNVLAVNAAASSGRLGVGGFLRATEVGDSGVRGPYPAGTGGLRGSGISARNGFGHEFGGRSGAGTGGAGGDFRRGTPAEGASAIRIAPGFRSGFSRHGAGSVGESRLEESDNAGAGGVVGSRAGTGGAGFGSDFKGQKFVRIGLLANQE